jgi:hypothetical protein
VVMLAECMQTWMAFHRSGLTAAANGLPERCAVKIFAQVH